LGKIQCQRFSPSSFCLPRPPDTLPFDFRQHLPPFSCVFRLRLGIYKEIKRITRLGSSTCSQFWSPLRCLGLWVCALPMIPLEPPPPPPYGLFLYQSSLPRIFFRRGLGVSSFPLPRFPPTPVIHPCDLERSTFTSGGAERASPSRHFCGIEYVSLTPPPHGENYFRLSFQGPLR